jgi:hypothetical protein
MAKITESACLIICLPESKRSNFDHLYLKTFCPRHLDTFAFSPSVGVSGGLLCFFAICWSHSWSDYSLK